MLVEADVVKVVPVTLVYAVLVDGTVGDVMLVSELDVFLVSPALGEMVSVTEDGVKLGDVIVDTVVSATVVDLVLEYPEVSASVLDVPPNCDIVVDVVSVSKLVVVFVGAVVDDVESVTEDNVTVCDLVSATVVDVAI